MSRVDLRYTFDTDSARITISMDGGLQPRWAHNVREIFYVSADREMWAARYETAPGFGLVGRELLFTIPDEFLDVQFTSATNYEVSSDDQTFLMVRPYAGASEEVGYAGPVLVHNFFEELKRLLPN